MCDYLFVFKCVGDVASCGASDSRIKRRLAIFTFGRGNVVYICSSANHFRND